MATGGIVVAEEHFTCAVCFEVYRDPHALTCLHTFCKECIQQLEHHQNVECPQCREISNIRTIRKDFKTQTLIDSHTAKQHEVPREVGSLCGMCGEEGSPVVSHCRECDHVMCEKCQGIHAKMKTTKFHPVTPLKEFIARIKAPYNEGTHILAITKNAFEKCAEDCTSALNKLENDEQDQIQKADEHIEKVVKNMRFDIHKKILLSNATPREILRDRKLLNEKNAKNIQTKIDFISEIMQTDDLSILLAMASDVKRILDEVREISRRKPLESKFMSSPVTLNFGNCEPDKLVEVVKRIVTPELMQHSQKIANLENIESQQRTQPTSHKYRRVGSVETNSVIERMRMISGQLHCAAGYDGIEVYDTHLNFIKNIKSDKLGWVTSVAQCGVSGDLIVACGGGLGGVGDGLHKLTSDGDYITCIMGGAFSDVCCPPGRLYALDYGEGKIRGFRKSDKNQVWREALGEGIELWYGSIDDKMLMRGDPVVMSSWHGDFACILENIKQKQQEVRLAGPGEVISTVIYNMDAQLIIVNSYLKAQVQVCYAVNNKWQTRCHCITPKEMEAFSNDAVVGTDGHTLWIVTDGPWKITKYELEGQTNCTL